MLFDLVCPRNVRMPWTCICRMGEAILSLAYSCLQSLIFFENDRLTVASSRSTPNRPLMACLST